MIKILRGSIKNKYINTKNIDRETTRPSQAIIRKSIFQLIDEEMKHAIVLDLFAGSGIMGIESISRGAKKVYFIDRSKGNIFNLKENLNRLNIMQYAELFSTDYRMAIKALYRRNICFDFIFLDPPYKWVEKFDILNYIKKYNILKTNTIIIHQMNYRINIDTEGFIIINEKIHGKNKFLLLKKEQ